MAAELKHLHLTVIDCERGYGKLGVGKCARWWRDSNNQSEGTWYKKTLCVDCSFGEARSKAETAAPVLTPLPKRTVKPLPPSTRIPSGIGTGNVKVDKPCLRCGEMMIRVHPARLRHDGCLPKPDVVVVVPPAPPCDGRLVALRRVIEASGFTQTGWAHAHNIQSPNLSKLLCGKAGISLEMAFAIEDSHPDAPKARSWIGYDPR